MAAVPKSRHQGNPAVAPTTSPDPGKQYPQRGAAPTATAKRRARNGRLSTSNGDAATAPVQARPGAAKSTIPASEWKLWHTATLTLLVAAIATVAVLLPREIGQRGGYEHARLLAWLASQVLLVAVGLVLGRGSTGLWRGIFVDTRNRVALSRVQMFGWTVVVLSAFLSATLGNVGLGVPGPLKVSIPEALWLAMGMSTASFVTAPVVRRMDASRTIAKNGRPADSAWTDIFRSDDAGFTHSVDLAKVQLIFFTIVLLLVYCVAIANAFDVTGTAINTLPATDEGFLILLAVSQGGYLAKKALPPSGA